MNIKTKQEILKAKTRADLFSSDEALMKKEFKEYCKLYHPDVDESDEAKKLFDIIMTIYNGEMVRASNTGKGNNQVYRFTNKDTNKGFELKNPVIFNNGICLVYHTMTKVAMTYDKSYEKFYNSYLRNVKNIKYPATGLRKEFERFFPKVVTNFESVTGKLCILLDKTAEVKSFGLIVKSYENRNTPFPERHAAWIMNRLYNLMVFMHFTGKVFNGISLDNLWVSPERHTILLFSGWEYTTGIGDSMIGCPKEVYNVLPIAVRDSHESCTMTDLESVKQIGRRLFKGSNASNILEFLNEGTSADDEPLDTWKNYEKAMLADYGKRKFIIWDSVPYDIN